MEQTFSELKKKDVINLIDGKNLGKVCDITFSFPENKVQGFTVTGCKGFRFSRQDIFLPISTVVKIGQDAVLVKFGKEGEGAPPPPPPNNCPPNNYPPQRPNCPPNNCPPPPRRSYEEYE